MGIIQVAIRLSDIAFRLRLLLGVQHYAFASL